MMKTRRFFAMVMAMSMSCSAVGVMSASANEDSPESTSDDARHNYTEYTQTDIKVEAEMVVDGAANRTLEDVAPDDLEDGIKSNTTDHRGSTPTIYVEVEWEELVFSFNYGTIDEYVWDIKDLEYKPKNVVGRGWNKNEADITFTNYSNRDVYCGCSFEKNTKTDLYDNVEISFTGEVHLMDALDKVPKSDVVTMKVENEPKETPDLDYKNPPALGKLCFYLSEEARTVVPPTTAEPETESGEHEHHFVYDQFGRLVCTGCNEVKHEYCIDEDEDGLCDECGLERDFCPECHIGGTCKCI